MTELVPLTRTGTDNFERSLIRSARADSPAPGAKLKLLAAVAGGAAVTTAAGVAQGTAGAKAAASTAAAAGTATATGQGALVGAAGKGVALSLLKWLGAGALAGTVLSVGATAVMPNRSSSVANKTAQVSPAEPQSRGVVRAAPAGAAADPIEVPAPETDLDEPGVEVLPAGSAAGAKPSVVDELKLLDDARKAVAAGNAGAALAALDARQKKHGAGTLGPEADVLRVEALLAAGQNQAAALRAQRFLTQHPTSPHAGRVRTLLTRLRAEARAAAPSTVVPAAPETKADQPTVSGPSQAAFGAAPATPTATPNSASFPTN